MGAGSGVDVGCGQRGEFADTQPGLDGGDQERLVASAGPGIGVRCCDQRVDFVVGEDLDLVALRQ